MSSSHWLMIQVAQSILTFLQRHPDDVDALNEAIMPFAYLTFLKPPPVLNPGAGKCADSDCALPVQLEPPSSRGPRSGHVPAESSESELEVVSPEGPRAGGHPTGTYEAQLQDDRPSSWSKSGRRGDSQIRHNNRSREVVENVAPHAGSR